MSLQLTGLDHLVLTVADIETTCRFYEALGMERQTFGAGRTALRFGDQKINLHPAEAPFEPKALRPTPGSTDLCLRTLADEATVLTALAEAGIAVEDGPVDRTGARAALRSIYVRDPDGNLIEIAREQPSPASS